jgi:hypothetical protein
MNIHKLLQETAKIGVPADAHQHYDHSEFFSFVTDNGEIGVIVEIKGNRARHIVAFPRETFRLASAFCTLYGEDEIPFQKFNKDFAQQICSTLRNINKPEFLDSLIYA